MNARFLNPGSVIFVWELVNDNIFIDAIYRIDSEFQFHDAIISVFIFKSVEIRTCKIFLESVFFISLAQTDVGFNQSVVLGIELE